MRCALLVSLFFAACGPAPVTPGPLPQTPFIALGSDFEGFAQWEKIDLGEHEVTGLHVAGHRVVYRNRTPAHGSKTFSKGTILVKVISDAAAGTTQVFAMAKRDPQFNPDGALGWEWFELNAAGGPAQVMWRGATSPTTGVYAGSLVTCNTCHTSGANDGVNTPELQLDTF
jgi:hypothetical protein